MLQHEKAELINEAEKKMLITLLKAIRQWDLDNFFKNKPSLPIEIRTRLNKAVNMFDFGGQGGLNYDN